MNARLTTLLLVLLVGGGVAAGCGGDGEDAGSGGGASAPAQTESAPTTTESGDSGGGGGQTIENPAEESGALEFQKPKLEAQAGQVTLVMPNPSPIPHAIGVRGNGVDERGETVQTGGTSKVTAELKPGEYEFYCPVPGHSEAGMKGPLTVE